MNQQDKDRLRELADLCGTYHSEGALIHTHSARGIVDAFKRSELAILSLLEENEALSKKAARYDWLRVGDTDLLVPFHTEEGLPVGVAFDDAVDAAMQHKGD